MQGLKIFTSIILMTPLVISLLFFPFYSIFDGMLINGEKLSEKTINKGATYFSVMAWMFIIGIYLIS